MTKLEALHFFVDLKLIEPYLAEAEWAANCFQS